MLFRKIKKYIQKTYNLSVVIQLFVSLKENMLFKMDLHIQKPNLISCYVFMGGFRIRLCAFRLSEFLASPNTSFFTVTDPIHILTN